MKRLLISVLCFLMLLSCVSCGNDGLTEYTDDAGITVRLPEGFVEFEQKGFTYSLYKDDVFFFSMREAFSDLEEKYELREDASLVEYAQLVAVGNGIDTQLVVESKDKVYFAYSTKSAEGTEHYFYATFKKGSDAFWLCQFACPADKYETMKENFDKWSDKIKVD